MGILLEVNPRLIEAVLGQWKRHFIGLPGVERDISKYRYIEDLMFVIADKLSRNWGLEFINTFSCHSNVGKIEYCLEKTMGAGWDMIHIKDLSVLNTDSPLRLSIMSKNHLVIEEVKRAKSLHGGPKSGS